MVARKLPLPMTPAVARELVALYSTWLLVTVDAEMILDASLRAERARSSFWDALVIEAAHRAGARRLLSEDMPAGRRFGWVVVENPFVAP